MPNVVFYLWLISTALIYVVMKRVYKEDEPINTLLKIKGILNNAGIVVYESIVNNPHREIYSTRTQTTTDFGNIGQNGKGSTLDYALASGYAELMERIENGCFAGGKALPWPFLKMLKEKYGFYFFPDEKMISENDFLNLPEYILDDIFSSVPREKRLSQIHAYFAQLRKKRLPGCISIPFRNLLTNELVYIPYNIFYMLVGSNGMAAGNTMNEAIFQGTCELFERYSAALVYYNRLTPPTIPFSVIEKRAPKIIKVIEDLQELGYKVIIKDFSINSQYPSVGVILIKGDHYRLNIGADTCFEIALSRCITEVYQGSSDDKSINMIMNPIPKKEFPYFENDSSESISKRTEEFVKFVKDGTGMFPFSLFGTDFSYSYSLDAFSEKSTYKDEVVAFVHNAQKHGFQFLVRNTSVMGFPAVHVYIPKISSIGRKSSSNDIIVDINLERNVANDKAKELFQNGNVLFSNPQLMYRLLEIFPISLHSNVRIKDLLDLDFVSNCIYDITPISYLLTLVALKLKRFKEADSYIDDFTKCKYISNLAYYNYIKKYIQFRLNNASEKTIAQNLPENIIKDMRDENIFENMYLPPCPNCKECKISNFCLTKGIYRFQQCIDTYSKDICLKQNFTYHHV